MDGVPLDIERREQLERYLVAAGHCSLGEVREFEPLAGGVSSRTVRIALADGREWVLKQSLAKLRVAADWFSDPRRIHREALGMQVLGELTPPGSIPRLIFDDERHHVLAMEAVPQPHENWKSILLAGNAPASSHILQFGCLLGAIHRNSRIRGRTLELQFSDRTFFESLRIEPYYEFSAQSETRAAPFYESLIAETRTSCEALVHGDYSPKNVLVRGDEIVLLDHEVIHWGDPTFDIGFAASHLLSKANHLPKMRADFVRAVRDFWTAYYVAHVPVDTPVVLPLDWPALERRCVRHTLGCLLARVVGRSPLEYLSYKARARQRESVVRLIRNVPQSMSEVSERFLTEIENGDT